MQTTVIRGTPRTVSIPAAPIEVDPASLIEVDPVPLNRSRFSAELADDLESLRLREEIERDRQREAEFARQRALAIQD